MATISNYKHTHTYTINIHDSQRLSRYTRPLLFLHDRSVPPNRSRQHHIFLSSFDEPTYYANATPAGNEHANTRHLTSRMFSIEGVNINCRCFDPHGKPRKGDYLYYSAIVEESSRHLLPIDTPSQTGSSFSLIQSGDAVIKPFVFLLPFRCYDLLFLIVNNYGLRTVSTFMPYNKFLHR